MDIKKAWNKFKKDILKEGIDLTGRCYMNSKQIANRTATIFICNDIPYEEQIKRSEKELENVMSYTSWTDEAKARSKESHDARVAIIKSDMEKFGTKENELVVTMNQIKESDAFKTFCKNAEIENTVTLSSDKQIQYGIGCYYVRVNY